MGQRSVQCARLAVLVVMLAMMGELGSANSADLPSTTPSPASSAPAPSLGPTPQMGADGSDVLNPRSFELRFGAFAHGVGDAEKGTYDVNPEVVFPELPMGQGQWWNMLIPRAHIGGLINLEGRTSAAYAGGLWTFPLPHRFFAEIFVDGDVHNGYLADAPPGHAGLGCPYLFHVGGSLGYRVSAHWSVMLTFDHQSNGHGIFGTECDGMGSYTTNPEINDYGRRLGYAF